MKRNDACLRSSRRWPSTLSWCGPMRRRPPSRRRRDTMRDCRSSAPHSRFTSLRPLRSRWSGATASRAAPRADQASPASMSRRSWNGARSGDYTEPEDSLALLAVRAAILVLLRNVFALGGAEQLFQFVEALGKFRPVAGEGMRFAMGGLGARPEIGGAVRVGGLHRERPPRGFSFDGRRL